MWAIELLGQCPDDLRAGRVGQAFEFLEVFIDVMPGRAPLARGANEDRALDGRGQ